MDTLVPHRCKIINLQVEKAQRAPNKINTKKIKLKQNNQVAANQPERQTPAVREKDTLYTEN